MEKQVKAPEKKPRPKTEKTPVSRKPFRYLRELSVVIIGVAVTFIGSGQINRWNEKQDLKQYLQAVKSELEDNLEIVREKGEYYDHAARFSRYLTSDAIGNLNADSVRKMNSEYGIDGNDFVLTYKNSALDMFKSSGSLRLIRDKTLYQSIIDCYSLLENLKTESDNYMARKIDEKYRVLLEIQEKDWQLLDPKFRRIFYFFAANTDLDTQFRACAEEIERTLSLLQAQLR